ncbi:MAG: SLBB domain-containing protein [Armatimonadota bacterium]
MLSLSPARLRALALVLLSALTLLAPRAGSAEDAPLEPEDVVTVQVSGEPQLSGAFTLDGRGEIALEMVGKIRAAGLTAAQLRDRLDEELKKYLKLFEVTVAVTTRASSRVLVYGEVAHPGTIKIRSGEGLLDVLAAAGQPTPNADTTRISILRKESGKSEVVELEKLLQDPANTVPVKPGDIITVPPKSLRVFNIDGEVQAPGQKKLDDAPTLYAAIQLARPTDRVDWSRVVLRRRDSALPLTLDLARIRTGKAEDDLRLQEGDHVTVMSRYAGTVTVRGEVKSAGEKELNGPTHLWDLLLGPSGGLTERADRRRVQIVREGEKPLVFDLTLVESGLAQGDDPMQRLLPGDLVFVPTGTAVLRGEVKAQGEKPLGTTTNIWDFVMTAGGGLTDLADRLRVQVIRDGKVARTVNLDDVSSGRKRAEDPEYALLPGDVIFVPNDDANRFAIVGGVKRPGKYTARPGMTLLDALASAEGIAASASRQLVVIPASRFDEHGQLRDEHEPSKTVRLDDKTDPKALGLVVVDARKLLKGDPKENVAIQAGDRIIVPEETREPRKPGFFERVLRLVPLAGLMLGGGYYGGY